MTATTEQQAPDPAVQFFGELQDFLQRLDLRLDLLETQLQRIERNSDNAARELAEVSRERWISRTAGGGRQ